MTAYETVMIIFVFTQVLLTLIGLAIKMQEHKK